MYNHLLRPLFREIEELESMYNGDLAGHEDSLKKAIRALQLLQARVTQHNEATDAIGYDPCEGEYDIDLTDEDLAEYEIYLKECNYAILY